MTARFLFSVAATLASLPLLAQNTASPTLPPAVPGMQDPQGMMAAYQAAQAAANRPGDEKLGCEELQAQFTEVMNDPAIKANVEAAGAAAQRDMAAIEAAQQAQKAQIAAGTATTAAGSVLPGGQWAALGSAVAQAEAAKAGAAGRLQQHAALAQGAMEAMPQLMRGQRLVELATAKQCEWAAGVMDANPEPESGQ